MKKLEVFFDGGCPLCRKEISVYMKADKEGVINWLDVSAEQRPEALPLPRQVLLNRFHVKKPDGTLISGAQGFIELWRHLPRWNWLATICATPGVPSGLEILYRGFLKLRRRA
jgi:predicted DCC family thiol-disulfide oxidoreductase YuxK